VVRDPDWKLAGNFPVFENDKLSLLAVFNEVLFWANEGKVCLQHQPHGLFSIFEG